MKRLSSDESYITLEQAYLYLLKDDQAILNFKELYIEYTGLTHDTVAGLKNSFQSRIRLDCIGKIFDIDKLLKIPEKTVVGIGQSMLGEFIKLSMPQLTRIEVIDSIIDKEINGLQDDLELGYFHLLVRGLAPNFEIDSASTESSKFFVKIEELKKIATGFNLNPDSSLIDEYIRSIKNKRSYKDDLRYKDKADYLGVAVALFVHRPDLFYKNKQINSYLIANIISHNMRLFNIGHNVANEKTVETIQKYIDPYLNTLNKIDKKAVLNRYGNKVTQEHITLSKKSPSDDNK